MRETFEFYCNDCFGWFLVNLNIHKRGDVAVICPNCDREHPRTIVDGEVLASNNWGFKDGDDNRYKSNHLMINRTDINRNAERIIPMKSAYSKEPRLHLLERVRGGFLAEAWMRKAANEEDGNDE